MTLDQEYLAAQIRAINALEAIQSAINDMPAPDSKMVIWADVADLQRIATDLEQITRDTR